MFSKMFLSFSHRCLSCFYFPTVLYGKQTMMLHRIVGILLLQIDVFWIVFLMVWIIFLETFQICGTSVFVEEFWGRF